jgi:serine/threonine protein kinase
MSSDDRPARANASKGQQNNLTGQKVAGCQVVKKLGQGAMGTVYLAEQLNLQRRIALKVLDPKYSRDLVYIERFEREARASAKLVHYNVVQVYDFGRFGETYYILNEFVEGSTVQDLIDENGPFLPDEAVDIVLQTARGLAAAEQAGIVHRDIKPENIMIDTESVVKITDFGLAKAVQDEAGATQAGIIVGTPFYMSPEQAKGLELDTRSDLYSLGVTFFHMVTGQLPFDGESVISVLLKHISGERPDPSEVNPAVPSAVSRLILRLMAREPEDRPGSAQELIGELKELQGSLKRGDTAEMSPAAPEIDPERRKRYKRLRKSLIARVRPRTAPPEVLKKMEDRCHTDGGVFVESANPLPEGSLAEVRFSVPGRPGLVEATGLVRWTVRQGLDAGMGITFLKVTPLEESEPKASASAAVRRANLSTAEIMTRLTDTGLKARLLKYYYANLGRAVTMQNLIGSLGVGKRMVETALREYCELGLAIDRGAKGITFVWPDDKELQNAIVDWIQEYGLR